MYENYELLMRLSKITIVFSLKKYRSNSYEKNFKEKWRA